MIRRRIIGSSARSGKKIPIGSVFLPQFYFAATNFLAPTSSLRARRRLRGKDTPICPSPNLSFTPPKVSASCHATCAAHRHDVSHKASQSFPRARSQQPRRGTTSRPLRTSASASVATKKLFIRLEFTEQKLLSIIASSLRPRPPPVPCPRNPISTGRSLAHPRDCDRRTDPRQRTSRYAL